MCLNNVPLGSVCQIQNDHTPERVLVNHSGWRKDGWTPRFASGWVPARQLKPVVLPYRLAECQAAFAPEHHTELAELIYLHDGDLRERWMLFTDMLEEGRWGDKYQPWAKHILEVIENLGRPLTIYDEVFSNEAYYVVPQEKFAFRRFYNLIIPPGQPDIHNQYCGNKIRPTLFRTITSPVSARPESNA